MENPKNDYEKYFLDNEIKAYTTKLKYYLNFRNEYNLNDLWQEFFKVYDKKYGYEELHKLRKNISILIKLSEYKKINEEDKFFISSKLFDYMDKKFIQMIDMYKLEDIFGEIVNWYTYLKNNYYKNLKFTSDEREIYFLKHLFIKNQKEFENLKIDNPYIILKFSKCVSYFYNNLEEKKQKNYKNFYENIVLYRITICKNNNYHEELGRSIYIYNKEKLKDKKFLSWFLNYFSGYGEQPIRIIKLFIILHIVFLFLMICPFTEIANNDLVIGKARNIEDVINIIYFNNTTMLTIGYGDFAPNNTITRVVVMIEEILGFVVGASFVTLTLRKLFRF